MTSLQTVEFDYSVVDDQTAETLRARGQRIREIQDRAIVDVGKELAEAQEQLADHGGGTFQAWAEAETGLSRGTIYNLINVYKQFGSHPNFGRLPIDRSALYLIAAPGTPETARDEALRLAETGERITHQTARRIVQEAEPEPTEAEIEIARSLIPRALLTWTKPANAGSLHNQVQKLEGGAGTTRKAVKAALYRMIEAGNVVELKDTYNRTVYALAHDPVVQAPPAAEDDDPSLYELATAFQGKLIEILGAGPKTYLQLRDSLAPDQNDQVRLDALRRALDTLFGEKRIAKDGGRYLLVESEPAKPATVIDELNAKFEKEAITILGRTDDGAEHRAIEVARRLVAAGLWDGHTPIQFNAYMLHDKLFGPAAVDPKMLVDGPGEDYRLFDDRALEWKPRILEMLAGGPIELAQIRARLGIALSDQDGMKALRETLAMLVNGKQLRQVRDLYFLQRPEPAAPARPTSWPPRYPTDLNARVLETIAVSPLPLEVLCERLGMTGPAQRNEVQAMLGILLSEDKVQEHRGMWSLAGAELPDVDDPEPVMEDLLDQPVVKDAPQTPVQRDADRLLDLLRKYQSAPLGFLFLRSETGLDEEAFTRARMYLLSAKLVVQEEHALKLAPPPAVELEPSTGLNDELDEPVNGNGMDVHFSSKTDEWHTPADILVRVIQVLTGIDLDPCSNSHESPNVPAAMHYTKEDDGLAQEWAGKVFLNPPYGRPIPQWLDKLVSEYEAGRVTQAIALVPARTDTAWFSALRDFPRCFLQGRLKFLTPEGTETDPAPFPNAVVYLGPDIDRFAAAFADLGDIYVRYQAPKDQDGVPV